MKRTSVLTLAFAILSLVFFILLVFLRIKFPAYPLMSYQDAFDILTPLVLIPLYWLMFRGTDAKDISLGEEIAFLVFAAFWVEGQGMHLSANSIDNLSEALARTKVLDILQTDIYKLTYFFDEHLSHYLWHIGIAGLIAVLIIHEWRRGTLQQTAWTPAILGGIIYGFTYFCIYLEGQTVPLGLPFALLVVVTILVWGRRLLTQRPVMAFFFISCLVGLLLLVGWGLYWGGFPQFSDVGLI